MLSNSNNKPFVTQFPIIEFYWTVLAFECLYIFTSFFFENTFFYHKSNYKLRCEKYSISRSVLQFTLTRSSFQRKIIWIWVRKLVYLNSRKTLLRSENFTWKYLRNWFNKEFRTFVCHLISPWKLLVDFEYYLFVFGKLKTCGILFIFKQPFFKPSNIRNQQAT